MNSKGNGRRNSVCYFPPLADLTKEPGLKKVEQQQEKVKVQFRDRPVARENQPYYKALAGDFSPNYNLAFHKSIKVTSINEMIVGNIGTDELRTSKTKKVINLTKIRNESTDSLDDIVAKRRKNTCHFG